MTASKTEHTPGPWLVNDPHHVTSPELIDDEYQFVDSADGSLHLSMCASIHDARLIAAAPEMLAALVWREQFEAREGEGSNDRFERVAEIFRRETGYLRPGKDCRVEPMEVRQQAWEEWLRAGNERARAAIAKATGSQS